jgi:hypothetical protein
VFHCPRCNPKNSVVIGRSRHCPKDGDHGNPFDSLHDAATLPTVRRAIHLMSFHAWVATDPTVGDTFYQAAVTLSVLDQSFKDAVDRNAQLTDFLRKLKQTSDPDVAKLVQSVLDDEPAYDGNVTRW